MMPVSMSKPTGHVRKGHVGRRHHVPAFWIRVVPTPNARSCDLQAADDHSGRCILPGSKVTAAADSDSDVA